MEKISPSLPDVAQSHDKVEAGVVAVHVAQLNIQLSRSCDVQYVPQLREVVSRRLIQPDVLAVLDDLASEAEVVENLALHGNRNNGLVLKHLFLGREPVDALVLRLAP